MSDGILSAKEIADFPRSTLSATALMASHERLRGLAARLREENIELRLQIEALLAHPVMAARQLRAERAARSVSTGERENE